MLLRSLVERPLLDSLRHYGIVERDVLHLIADAETHVGTQGIRQRVELRQAAHLHLAIAAPAGGQQRGAGERRGKNDLFHCR